MVIHTGTNYIENSPLETCFDNFQTLIDLTAQKYPVTKIIISSLIIQKDGYDTKRSQLNNKISRLRSYANVHFVNNKSINHEMLYDNKHVKRRKIGILVVNLKDCIFNRISRRSHPTPSKEPKNWPNKAAETSTIPSVPVSNNRPPPLMPGLMHPEPAHEATRAHKSYAVAVKTLHNYSADLNQTLLQLIKLYEMIRQT